MEWNHGRRALISTGALTPRDLSWKMGGSFQPPPPFVAQDIHTMHFANSPAFYLSIDDSVLLFGRYICSCSAIQSKERNGSNSGGGGLEGGWRR